MNINYDLYKIFVCAAECGGITAAAEKLYISQPAVSQSIHSLEESLGCRLFVRTAKRVKLTAEGETLYSYVSKGLQSIEDGERRVSAMLRLDAGEIRIGASDMTLEFCLLPYLEQFHTSCPNVKISITNNPTPQTIELLQAGKIDFAAVSEPFEQGDFETIPVKEIRDIFICGKDCGLHDGISAAEIPSDRLILLEKNTSTRAFVDGELKKRGITAKPKFELATSGQIVNFSARNLGIGCVVEDFARQAAASGSVREIRIADPFPPRRICIARKTKYVSRAADKLLELIRRM